MAKAVRVSEPALQWIEQEAERIAGTFGAVAAEEFKDRIKTAIEAVAAFPNMTKRGRIPGSRTITVHKRTVLTIVERDGALVVAAARNHWQGDAFEPREAYSAADDELREEPADGGPKG
jgi:plasmid stabilization system protein ParE